MGGLALFFSLLLTLPAALLGALIVAPSPAGKLALLTVIVDEKGFVLIGAGLIGGLLAFAAMRRGHGLGGLLSLVAAVAAIGLGALPIAQAVKLAGDRKVVLDYGRYLQAAADIGDAHPAKTVVYASPGGHALAMDIYPAAGHTGAAFVAASGAASSGPTPAVVVIHGGGWSAGDKGEAPLFNAWLSQQGFTVFDIQYRLAPQPNWQTATGDVKCAIGWIKAHANGPDFRIDPARVHLLGRSAGAHLALLAATSLGDANLMPSCSAGDTSVASVAALYPPTDLVWGYEHTKNPLVYDTTQKIRDFLGGRPDTVPSAYRLASITSRVDGRPTPMPRVLLAHGGRDQFVGVEHTMRLAARMHAAGLAPDVILVPYGQHGFDYVSGGLSGQILERALLRLFKDEP